MEFLTGLGNLGSSAASYILPFIFVLTIVVFFHELGHFTVARWCGVSVRTFSIGFGPELLGFTDRKGTRWRLSLIPLGGYVKFFGDENETSLGSREALAAMPPADRGRTFAGKSVGRRAAIVAAGPIANFLLSIVIFTLVFTVYGRQEMTPRVDAVVADSAAAKAGLQAGDEIVAINGTHIANFGDMQRIIDPSAGIELQVTLLRAGKQFTVPVTPEAKENPPGSGHVGGVLGIQRTIAATDRATKIYPLPQAVGLAASETWFVVERTITYLFGVAEGRESAQELGGPIRVAQIASQAAAISFGTLLAIAAYLSASIGLINLFPVPMLDGGHLLFFAAEAIRGRPLSDRIQEIGFRIGLVAVLLLMVFAFGNDFRSLNWL